jgi:hypothetical protein
MVDSVARRTGLEARVVVERMAQSPRNSQRRRNSILSLLLIIVDDNSNYYNNITRQRFYWHTGAVGWFISRPLARRFAAHAERFLALEYVQKEVLSRCHAKFL